MKHNTTTTRRRRRGFTLIELLVVMSIIALLLSILMPALGRARAEAMLAKDQTQVKAIFSGFSMWTPSHNGIYPTPGLENREGVIRGRGREDMNRNDHASVLSMCVMQNLFSTDILVSPTEGSAFVAPMSNYGYDEYSITDDIYWDEENEAEGREGLKNDLNTESHNSYGIMPVTGLRKKQQWCVSTHNPSAFPIVGTRGPEMTVSGGAISSIDEYSKSFLMHGIEDDYTGTISFGDAHNEVLETFYPIATTYIKSDGVTAFMDNIFVEELDQTLDDFYMPGSLDTGQGADAVLTHVIQTIGGQPADGTGGKAVEFIYD